MTRPSSPFPPASTNGRLDEIAERLARLETAYNHTDARRDAFERFALTGELAAPMTTDQVAIILNTTPKAVHELKGTGKLARRFGSRGFHPDDVRAYLNLRGENHVDDDSTTVAADGTDTAGSAAAVRGVGIHTASVPRGVRLGLPPGSEGDDRTVPARVPDSAEPVPARH